MPQREHKSINHDMLRFEELTRSFNQQDTAGCRVASWLEQIQKSTELPSIELPSTRESGRSLHKATDFANNLDTRQQYVRDDDAKTLLSCPGSVAPPDYARASRNSLASPGSKSRQASSHHEHRFGKRKRHKTRTDRYALGGEKKAESSKRLRSSGSRRKREPKKHRIGREIMDEFTPWAVAHEKITVSSVWLNVPKLGSSRQVKPRLSVGMLLNGKGSRTQPSQ